MGVCWYEWYFMTSTERRSTTLSEQIHGLNQLAGLYLPCFRKVHHPRSIKDLFIVNVSTLHDTIVQ